VKAISTLLNGRDAMMCRHLGLMATVATLALGSMIAAGK
jgi:hypothetical protein